GRDRARPCLPGRPVRALKVRSHEGLRPFHLMTASAAVPEGDEWRSWEKTPMITPHRRLVDSLPRFGMCLGLAGALFIAGCGHPREGTLKLSPEARAPFTAYLPVPTRGAKGRIVEQRPIGIKDRGVAGTKNPVKPGIPPR